ncbi:MAG: hypothetical protein U5R49_23185 [Deltaproteobacteria bacterium]|nr:hypothetical protein [Deltaproteobacteria bacterium]
MDASWLLQWIDSVLIAPYRWWQNPVTGWWVGTVVLCLWAVLLGDATIRVVMRVNLRFVQEAMDETVQRHEQSMNAMRAGDKSAYKAINRLANEAFGKTFFLQLAMAAASLWPIPLALAWLDFRFSNVDFPLPVHLPFLGHQVGYAFIFFPAYILVRIVFNNLKRAWSK